MKSMYSATWVSGVFTIAVALALLLPGSAHAQANIPGISGASFAFTAGAGEISTPDGGSVHFWGYQAPGANPAGVPQYPGPTLILDQGQQVTITLRSNLPYNKCTSIIFPGHAVSATGGTPGLLTRESCSAASPVTYEFTATHPGTYTYYSGTEMELQVEMGLVGAIIVRPSDYSATANRIAYPGVAYDHEFLFLATQIDPLIHQLAEQGRFSEIDMKNYFPVYWLLNGRAAPDSMSMPFVSWLPHQPYNCLPRTTPGAKVLMRLIGGDQGQHPFHFHGNNSDIVARDGRKLAHPRSVFTTLTVQGETVDHLFTWTGAKMGWDIYGTPADGMPAHVCIDTDGDGIGTKAEGSTYDYEYCGDHGKKFPVILPQLQNLTFGGWWSGSPFMGNAAPLPPGEGGLNPNSGYFFMWHSHAEKELTNFDIFPGGMMTMLAVEPPGTVIQ